MGQPGQDTHLGSTLKEEKKDMITTILAKNVDLFPWTVADMLSIDPRIISHKLSIYKEAKTIAKKERRMGEKKRLVAKTRSTQAPRCRVYPGNTLHYLVGKYGVGPEE